MPRVDVRIGARLALAFAPLIALLVVVAGLGLARLAALNAEFTRVVVDRSAKTQLVHAIAGEDHALLRAVQEAQAAGGLDMRALGEARRNLGALLEELDRAFAGEGEEARGLQQAVHDRHSSYLVSLARYTRLLEAGRGDEARSLLQSNLKRDLDTASAALAALSAFQAKAMRQGIAEAAESYAQARDWTVAVALAALLASLAIAFATARSITRPLELAVTVAQRVAAGDLAMRVEPRGRDETGRLMAALKVMNASLTRIVGAVRGGSDRVAETAAQLLGANERLAARSEEQAAALEETASAMEQFTASALQNAENAHRASELAEAARVTATGGEAAMGRVAGTMAAIDASARRIGDVIAFIDQIAFQTHLIALNAAVEAAHAGEHGRGFGAIALEVRGLAGRCAVSAREAKALVDDANARVRAGRAEVDAAVRTMQDVLAGAAQVAALMGEIADASREQRTAVGGVTEMLARMESATQQNAGLVEQVFGAMRGLEEQARGLAELVRVFELAPPDEPAQPKVGEVIPARAFQA